jgi:hypothetical protein
VAHHSLQTKRRADKALNVPTKGRRSYEIATGVECIPANLPALVRKLIFQAEAEGKWLDALAAAVRQGNGNRDEVFQIAAQLTGVDPENGITALHLQPKTQNKP